ncbi:MAG: DNA polymerase III subunit alpha, partial [Myxococcales bacterium]
TYKLISTADAVGIFQMESGGMRKLLTRIKPSSFEDLIAVLALFRPGPLDSGMVEEFIKRRDGREAVRYPDPALEPILSETYGVIVYQEQVMQIAQVYAGYSLGDADLLRRAMGKKKAEAMAREKKTFIEGAVGKGHPQAKAEEIFQQMETFAAYGFNKSHSAAYALLSFQTAYLKAHYTKEFMAALLTMEMGDTDKVYKNLADCRQHGIGVLPPDVNSSAADFTVCEEGIRFGLGAVKGAGDKAVDAIVEARAEGPYTSLADFSLRAGSTQVNRRIMESFIKAGAFDSICHSRRRLLEGLDGALAWAARVGKDKVAGQFGLFSEGAGESEPEPSLPDVDPWDDATRLTAEHDVVGFYISGHPLDRYQDDLQLLGTLTMPEVESRRDQEMVALAGVTNTVRLKNSKKGDRYATFNLEDRDGVIEVITWPKTFLECEEAVVGREPVYVYGRLEFGEQRGGPAVAGDEGGFIMKPQIIAEKVVPLTQARCERAGRVDFLVRRGDLSVDALPRLRDILLRHPGGCRPYLLVRRPGESETEIELPKSLLIAPTDSFLADVEKILGPGNTRLRAAVVTPHPQGENAVG